MKKTLLQMVCTCLVLGVIFTANQMAVEHGMAQAETVSAGIQESVELPVIMYHSILKDQAQAGEYILSPDTLAADLDYLLERGYQTVTIADLIDYVDGLADLPEKPVLITFDDGHFNNYLYAYPLLKERGMRAVVSVIGTQTEQFTASGQENAYWSYLSLDRLREMRDVFEIQNHSFDMHATSPRRGCTRMRGEDLEAWRALLIDDTEKTQDLLAGAGLSAPTCYTYPFGMYSSETEEILRSLGFLCTLTCESRVNTLTRDPECLYRLGRFNRPSGISPEAFFRDVLDSGE